MSVLLNLEISFEDRVQIMCVHIVNAIHDFGDQGHISKNFQDTPNSICANLVIIWPLV